MKCDRRSVKANLMSLKELGYDINLKHGIFIRLEFEESELRMLIDGVLFSKNISRSQAKRLIEKLKTLGSNQFSAKVSHIANLPELQHSNNTRVMLNLDVINDAISKNKKISFIYFSNFDKKFFKLFFFITRSKKFEAGKRKFFRPLGDGAIQPQRGLSDLQAAWMPRSLVAFTSQKILECMSKILTMKI